MRDYAPVELNDLLKHDVQQLVRLAIAEDLGQAIDWTTVCLISPDSRGGCQIAARQPGTAAGVALLGWIIEEFDADVEVEVLVEDGQKIAAKQVIARLRGNVRDLLTTERVALNLLSRLFGIATLTARYVSAIAATQARLYDTRKTTPGWRRLEKYAVRCGGGCNHRHGLYDGFLIKDNHLALGGDGTQALDIAEATSKAIRWRGSRVENLTAPNIVEVEVDSLEQLAQVLPVAPDIVLLDNFSLESLSEAVRMRNQVAPKVELEASGNVRIDTILSIAQTGVDRISCGALTHQATSLDLGLDWWDANAS